MTRRSAIKNPSHPASTTPETVRGPGKQQVLRDLLARSEGASLGELQAASGWQAHSVRAAISGLRKQGLEVACERTNEGARRYRLIAPADADGSAARAEDGRQ